MGVAFVTGVGDGVVIVVGGVGVGVGVHVHIVIAGIAAGIVGIALGGYWLTNKYRTSMDN